MHSGIRAISIMHMLRQLRPNGIPVMFEVIYCKNSGKVESFKQYNLSPEPGEKEARYGEVSDFTMDSLRNQIIGEPIEIEADTIKGLNLINDLID